MSGYNIIAEVGSFLIERLRGGMVPGLIAARDSIVLGDGEGDSVITLTLYDAQILNRSFTKEFSNSWPLSLRYILSVNSKANPDIKAETEHRILGRAIGILGEKPIIRNAAFLGGGDIPIEVSMINLETDERIKICEHIFGTFRTSVFYCAEPVFIDSATIGQAERVLNG